MVRNKQHMNTILVVPAVPFPVLWAGLTASGFVHKHCYTVGQNWPSGQKTSGPTGATHTGCNLSCVCGEVLSESTRGCGVDSRPVGGAVTPWLKSCVTLLIVLIRRQRFGSQLQTACCVFWSKVSKGLFWWDGVDATECVCFLQSGALVM